jgi:serine/threonine-protein kinase RsbW
MTAEIIRLDLPASHKYLNVASACISEMLSRVQGIPNMEQTVYNIQLAVQEACANIVNHAYSDDQGRIGLTLLLDGSPPVMSIELRDAGEPFNPTDTADPDLDIPQIHGYGVFLMRELMDEVVYESRSGANYLRMVKRL